MRNWFVASFVALLSLNCGLEEGDAEELVGESSADLATKGPIGVSIDKLGHRFTDWGFDIKQDCEPGAAPDCVPPIAKRLANDPAWAREIFGSGKMNVLRIPIRADDDGVDENGRFKPEYYRVIVQAAKAALAANPNVRIFASRNTVHDCDKATPQCLDFHKALKQGGVANGQVMMSKYGALLAEYLEWFDAQGVHVSILGPDNEPTNNEGNLTIGRISDAIDALDTRYKKARPKLMLNDGSRPDVAFLKAVDEKKKWNLVGFAGTHYQSDERKERHALLDQFANFAHQQGKTDVWDTEYHFTDNKPGDDKPGVQGEYGDAALGVYGVFDQLDAGFSGIVWWGYKPPSDGTSKSEIQTALVESIGGGWPLATTKNDAARRAFSTRAIRQGKDVVVWVVNDTDKSIPKKPIHFKSAAGKDVNAKTKPTFERWVQKPGVAGGKMTHESGVGGLEKGDAFVGYPEHSITVVRVPDVY